jgi:hypothetical protein
MALSDTSAYLSYLKYTNRKMLELVDHILASSAKPPIIALLSDHGFRYFSGEYNRYAFSDILSVHLPSRRYENFPDTMTNVNFFSTILNTEFELNLPQHPDTSFVIDF